MPVTESSEAQFLFEISGTELRVVDFTAHERISSPFEVNLNLASKEEINFDDVIGKESLLTILGDEEDRYFHGIICQFMQTGSKGNFLLYKAKMVPSLWLLSLEQDCCIFQDESVQDIISKILTEDGIPADRFDFRIQRTLDPREYCVQYRETDLNFISRLLEEEGIFYSFEHSEEKHLLVFGDGTVNYQPIEGEANILYHATDSMVSMKEVVNSIILSQQIKSGKYTLRDFNYEKPALDLTAQEEGEANKKLEVYDYPGEYSDDRVGNYLAKIRLQESMLFQNKAEGQSDCPRFTTGLTFNLTDHDQDNFNQEYLLVEILHKGTQPQALEEYTASGSSFSYSNQFLSIPSSVTYRSESLPGRCF